MTAGWISLLTALTALVLAIKVGLQYLQRRKLHQLVWAVALLLFATGAVCQCIGQWFTWTPLTYRLWYLTGALLTAAYLGQGTAYLQFRKKTANLLMLILLAASIAGVVAVFYRSA